MTAATNKPRHAANGLLRKDHWPEGVYTISMDSLDHLGVDKEGTLYWDGALIKTTRKITLDTKEFVLACFVAGATIIGAAATVVQAWFAAFPVKP
jgi:hypothetical protein